MFGAVCVKVDALRDVRLRNPVEKHTVLGGLNVRANGHERDLMVVLLVKLHAVREVYVYGRLVVFVSLVVEEVRGLDRSTPDSVSPSVHGGPPLVGV